MVYHLTNFSKQSTFGTRWVDICSSNSYGRRVFLLDCEEEVCNKTRERTKTWNEEFNWWKVDTSLLFAKSDLKTKKMVRTVWEWQIREGRRKLDLIEDV